MSPPDLALGSVTVHRVIDMDPFRLKLSFILPQADLAEVDEHGRIWRTAISTTRPGMCCSPCRAMSSASAAR